MGVGENQESVLRFFDMPAPHTMVDGGILRWDASTKKFVTAAKTTVVALTDNSAGTADNTVAAMPNPADAPATADALRDDLVANFIPAVRNNIADLAAKINEIRTVLVGELIN